VTGEILKISKIALIYGIVAGILGGIFNNILASANTGLLMTYMELAASFFYAAVVAFVFGLRAKEWKELKLSYIFWVVVDGFSVVGNIIFFTILPVEIAIMNLVVYGISLALLVTCFFKQQ